MEDLCFHQRLLDYIENFASECLPQQVNCDSEWMDIDADDKFVDGSSNDQVFQPFPDPDDPDFDLLFERNVFHIVRVRQIHSRKHTSNLFQVSIQKCR